MTTLWDVLKRDGTIQASDAAKTAARSGKDIPRKNFAYQGGPKAEDLKLPTDTEGRTRSAMSRFNQTSIPSDKKAAVAKRIGKAAKKYGIKMNEFKKHMEAFGMDVGHRMPNLTRKVGHRGGQGGHRQPNQSMGHIKVRRVI